MYALIVRKGVIQNPKMKGASTMDLIRVGRRRRKKELIRVSVIVFLVSLFLAAFLLYYSQVPEYENRRNIRLCGGWILEKEMFDETPGNLHPYVEKTGEVLGGVHVYTNGDGTMYQRDTGVYIGCLPDNMPDIGRVRIFAGRLPDKEGEAALTLSALEKLGLSYELGQKIEITYGKYYSHSSLLADKREQEYRTKTLVVTGILYNYQDMWNTGQGMPSVVITAEDFEKLDAQKLHLGFYALRGEYEGVNTEFAGRLAAEDDTVHYNSNVYDAVLWDSRTANLWVLASVMVIGCCAMAYIIIQENKRRRNFYYLMRCIGADKLQIRAFSVQESVLTIIPAAVSGIASAYMLCAVVELFVSIKEDIGWFFTFDPVVLVQIAGAIFVTAAVSLLASQASLLHRRIVDGQERLTQRRADRLRKKAVRYGGNRLITPSGTARRMEAMHPVRTALLRVVGIAVCSVVLYGITTICEDIAYYSNVKNVSRDFVIEMPEDYGFADTTLRSIELVDGLRRVDYISGQSIHKLSWQGMENSQWYSGRVDMLTDDEKYSYDDIYDMLFGEVYYNNTERIWKVFSDNIEWDGADYGKFRSGEQVFVVGNVSGDTSISPGTMVHIETQTKDVEVQVAAVIPYELAFRYLAQGNSSCTIVGSELLGRQVAEADGRDFRYTQAEIFFADYTNADFTAQQLTIIAVRSGGRYRTEYSFVKQEQDKLVHKLLMYGGFMLAVFVMYAVIRIGILKDETVQLGASNLRLKQVGADDGFIVKQAVAAALREGLWLFAAVPVVVAVRGLAYMEEAVGSYRPGMTYTYTALVSRRLNRWFEYEPTAGAEIRLIPVRLLDLQYEWYLLFIVLIIVLFAAVSAALAKKELCGGARQMHSDR